MENVQGSIGPCGAVKVVQILASSHRIALHPPAKDYPLKLDQTDREIIRELQEDGRRSLRDIGRTLGIAEATIRLRTKRLHDSGVLQIVAFADPTKIGPAQLALVFIETDPGAHDRIIAEIQDWPEISYLSSTIGDSDICAQCVSRDQEALWGMRQRLAALSGVRAIRVVPEVRVHKLRFTTPMEDPGSEAS